MRIQITGATIAPTWNTIQRLIRETLNTDTGRLTRIARPDGQCNYRECASYACTFTPETGDAIAVDIEVTR